LLRTCRNIDINQALQIRPWLESVKGFERLEQCFLNEILGFVAFPFEPHREPEQPVHMRKHFRFKRCPRPFVRV
jgi:hypothetical protein